MRHKTFYADKVSKIDFCGKIIWYSDHVSVFEPPFAIQSTEGEHDYNKCEHCQENLQGLIEELSSRFNGKKEKQPFPFCCAYHANLLKIKEFNRSAFENTPVMVAYKIIYTIQHIINNYNTEHWYKDITDYVAWVVDSFGKVPEDCGEPLYLSSYISYITGFLEKNSELPDEKKFRLIEHFQAYIHPQKNNKKQNTDFATLLKTYQKWLNIFPFEISYFRNLKDHFKMNLPLLNGTPEINKYSGIANAKMHTKGSLIYVLENLTKSLLAKVDFRQLRKQGLIKDVDTTKLEFKEATLSTKTAEITRKFSNGELKYIKTLKDWFEAHKEYFMDLETLLKNLPPQQINKSPFSVLEWATIFYYADETKLLPENRKIKERMEQFRTKHSINTTFANFNKSYYEAKKRINEKNDYPIEKLKKIIPFLKNNYQQTVTKVENDITFLENESTEY